MAEVEYQESLGSLIRGILDDLRQLVRDEMALARVELGEQATRAKIAMASLGIAIGTLVFGATFLLIAVALGLADLLEWPAWAGFLALALVLSVAGAAMLAVGRKRLQAVKPVPEQTIQSIKENSAWIAKRLSSVKG